MINRGSIVYDGELSGVNAALCERKVVRLVLSEEVAIPVLEAYGGFRGMDGATATFYVERAEVRDFSRRVLGELPVADLTIEEVPLEEGIARLYRGEGSAEAEGGAHG